MAEMSVRMTLTLVDTASPGVRAFMALLDQLAPKVTGLSNRLNTLESNLTKTGRAASTAAVGIGTYDVAVTKAEGNTARFTGSVGGASGAMRTFETGVRGLSAILTSFATMMATFSTAFATASNNIAAATANMGHANAQMGTLTTRVHSLTHSLQGLAEAWMAVKLFQAGKASVNEASEFQQLEARVKALDLPGDQTQAVIGRARNLSKQLRFVSVNEAMEANVGAIAGLGHNDPELIDKTLPDALRVAMILRARGDKSEMKDLVRNLYGMAEARGQTSSATDMVQTFNLMQQNAAATGMKLTTKDVEAVFRQLKYGLGTMVSDEGMINILAFANQLKASGHGGGGGSGGQGITQAGTASTQVAKWALGGVKNKQTAQLLVDMGLMDPLKILNDSSTTEVNVASKSIRDSDKAIRDPIGWLMGLAPVFLAFVRNNADKFYPGGTDIRDEKATEEALSRLGVMLTAGQGGVNVGNMIMQAVLARPASRIQEESKLTFGSKKTSEAFADVEALYEIRVKEFEASLNNIQIIIGEKLLPVLSAFLDKAAVFVQWLADVAAASPAATTLTTFALAIAAVALALSGLNRLFGIFGALRGLIVALEGPAMGLGAAFTAAATAATAASGPISAAFSVIGVAMRLLVPIAAALLIGWDIGTIVATLNVGGRTIHDWAVEFMNKMVTAFANGWARIKHYLGLITEAQKDKEISINNALEKETAKWANKQNEGKQTSFKAPVDENERPTISAAEIASAVQLQRQIDLATNPMVGTRPYKTLTQAEQQQSTLNRVMANTRGPAVDMMETAGGSHKETPAQKLARETEEAAKNIVTGKYAGKPVAGRGKVYNEGASQAQQDFRMSMSEMQQRLRRLDSDYKAMQVSIEEHFNRREEAIMEGYTSVIGDLETRLAALKIPQKDSKGKTVPIDRAAIDRVEADLSIKRDERGTALVENQNARDRAITEYKKAQEDADRYGESVSGNRHMAELMRLRKLLEDKKKLFIVNNDLERANITQGQLTRAEAGIAYDMEYTKLKGVLDSYQDKQNQVTDEVKGGLKGQMEAETDLYLLRREQAVAIQEVIEQLRTYAEINQDPRLKAQVQGLDTTAKSALASLSPEAIRIKNIVGGAFTDLFNGVMNRTKSATDLIKDFFKSIVTGVNDLVAKHLSEMITEAIFGPLRGTGAGSGGNGFFGILSDYANSQSGGGGRMTGGTGGGGGSGFFGQLGGAMSSLFGDKRGVAPVAQAYDDPSIGAEYMQTGGFEGIANWFSSLWGGASYATGIDRVPYDMYAKIHKDERIVNAQQNMALERGQLRLGKGGEGITQHNNFILNEPTSKHTQNQIAQRQYGLIQSGRRIR